MQQSVYEKNPPAGCAWVHDGDIWYSPNSVWFTPPPPHDNKLDIITPGESTAAEFQEPHWWNPVTEWMGFVPKQPVPYTGAWFQPLHNLPGNINPLSSGGYQLSETRIAAWNHIEEQLVLVVRALCHKNKFACSYPFAPQDWNYDAVHHSEEKAMEQIKNGRDWFAMWISLVYWMTRKTPQAASFVEGLTPPTWFIQLVLELPTQQATWDLVCTAPLLQRTWKWNRVGVWLHHPADVDDQPPARWFVEQGVPV
ncbi:hypothetical protein AN958_02230 [Leucoagaricus sp. SymC.cos]|nr:hypothetical protein AN958_02230 [Leucoagaricus sp. SymC.cos]